MTLSEFIKIWYQKIFQYVRDERLLDKQEEFYQLDIEPFIEIIY